MDVQRWEHFEHDADIGLRATAPTREALFEAMGEALTALVTASVLIRNNTCLILIPENFMTEKIITSPAE